MSQSNQDPQQDPQQHSQHDAPQESRGAASGATGPGASHAHPQQHVSGRTTVIVLLVLLAVAAVAAVGGILPRVHARKALAAQTTALAAPDVIAIRPNASTPDTEIVLPGNIYAYTDSPIYARTNGYLEHWYFDIGAHVRKGQLLAIISSPEIDKQLLQARADLTTAETTAGFARQTASRYTNLLQSDAVSAQDTENATTQAASTSSSVKSAQANVQRLQELQSFERIYAPFNGVVTARGIDVGQLVDAGATRELFHLAATDTLRVYINVPQIYSREAVPGVKADLVFSEFPGRRFRGTLVRTARAIDPTSRTLLVEVDVDNRKGELAPGAYTEVHMKLSREVPTAAIPVSALMFRSEGLRVGTAVHGPNGDTAKLVPITLGHDDGQTVQVISGLDPEALVIQNPPDSLLDGEPVHIVQPQKNQNVPGTGGQQGGRQQDQGGGGDQGGQGNPGMGKEKSR